MSGKTGKNMKDQSSLQRMFFIAFAAVTLVTALLAPPAFASSEAVLAEILSDGSTRQSNNPRSDREASLDSTSTLVDYIHFAIRNNPALKAFSDYSDALWQVPAQRRSLPDPMLSFGYFAKNVETRVGPQEDSWMVSQKFPFFGKLSLKGQVAERDARIADQTYNEKFLDLIYHVKGSYYDYYRVYNEIEVLKEEKKVISHMQEVAQIKYASGQVSQQDVLKAQLALSKLEDKLTKLERELTTVITRFNKLLNRHPLAPLAQPQAEFSESFIEDIEKAYSVADKYRPELKSADIAIEKALKLGALARREYFPDLTLSMQYVRVGDRPISTLPENGKDAALLKASINLPIWLGRRSAAVKEAEAREALARHGKEAIATSIHSDVQDAYTKVETARELVDLYEHVIIPQAEQTFMASEAGYRTGEVDFLNYLDSERALLTLRRTYYGVKADLGKQLAYFERTTGQSISLRGLGKIK